MMDRSLILPQLIRRHAAEAPDRVFLQQVAGGQMTYAGLDQGAREWAAALAGLGVGAGQTVAVMLPNSFDIVRMWVATGLLKAIEVPINTAYKGGLLTHVINNSGTQILFTTSAFLDRLQLVAADLTALRRIVLLDREEEQGILSDTDIVLSGAEALSGWGPLESEGPEHYDIASIVYTSGTTGPSKGVRMPWAQCHAMASGCIPLDGLDSTDAWYGPFPLFHVGGKLALYAAALFGGRYVIREAFSTSAFWDDIRSFDCTCAQLIGTTASYIWSLPRSDRDKDHRLRNVLMSPMPADVEAFQERYGFRACNVFNMTELSSPIWTQWDSRGRSCGKLREGYEVRLVDDHDEEVPDGQTGEIIVRARDPWVLNDGYHGMADKTVEAWRNGWFHTGDIGMKDADGYYFYLDRKKDALRRRGENISSMEVEAVINDFEGVLECAVVGVPSEHGEDEVMVFLRTHHPDRFSFLDLVNFLIPRLPRFMIPRYYEIRDGLPRTPTEKVQKVELRKIGVSDKTWDLEKSGIVLPR